ncbi:protein of unknown function [Tenacibaculum sp. 190130A14a]|uniref:Uncharacterized protein n=1 Tax=Tenacibaculum polynesiense TaxID=3137857 RepID=A0ABM9P6F5_9FLAO
MNSLLINSIEKQLLLMLGIRRIVGSLTIDVTTITFRFMVFKNVILILVIK